MAGEAGEGLAEVLDTNTEADAAAVESVASEEGNSTSTGAGGTAAAAEPEWRAPVNEMMSGLSSEVRQQIAELRQLIERSQRFQQPAPQREPEPKKSDYDDLNYWLQNKGDPNFYQYLQSIKKTADERVSKVEKMFEDQKRQASFAQNREKIANHLQSQAEASAKEAHIPESLKEMYARFLVTDIQSGNNGRAHDPFRYDYRAAAKNFNTMIENHVKSIQQEQIKAAETQKGKPATTGSGAATKPGGKEKTGDFSELRSMVEQSFGNK